MKLIILTATFAIGIIGMLNAAKLPDYLKKCKRTEETEQCFIDNAQAAISQLAENGETKFNLQNLRPIHVDKINLQATPDLKIELENVKFFHFDKLKVTGGHINENEMVFKAHMNRVEMVGAYDINGRILILPIQGNGVMNMTMVGLDVVYTGKFHVEERKGKKYLQIESNAEDTDLRMAKLDRVYFNFENLFNGDPRLGPEMNRFLNENWQDVFAEVQQAIEQTAAFSIMNYFVNGYLHYLPLGDLFNES